MTYTRNHEYKSLAHITHIYRSAVSYKALDDKLQSTLRIFSDGIAPTSYPLVHEHYILDGYLEGLSSGDDWGKEIASEIRLYLTEDTRPVINGKTIRDDEDFIQYLYSLIK